MRWLVQGAALVAVRHWRGDRQMGGVDAGGCLICPAVHVRPLRGLSTLLALSPGRSRPWWLASRRPRARSTTWGHSWCDPSGVSACTGAFPMVLPVRSVPSLWCYRALRSPPYGGGLGGAFGCAGVRLRPRRGRTMNNPRSSRGREGERSEASRHRATWGYRWSASKDLGEVSRGRRHAGGVAGGCGRLDGWMQAGWQVDAGGCLICPAVHVRPLRGLSTLLALSPGRSRSWWLASRRPRARSTTWGHSWCDPSGVSASPELSGGVISGTVP